MAKSNALQAALMMSAGKAPAPLPTASVAPPAERKAPATPPTGRQSNRAELVNVSAWLHPQFKQNLLMLKALGHGDVQTLMADALNELFARHNLPQVRGE